MKTNPQIHSARFLTAGLLAASLAVLAFNGCSRPEQSNAKAQVKDAYEDTKAAMANAWAKVKVHTYKKRGDFAAHAQALSSRMESNLSKLRADYSDAKASASRKAALEELKKSEADYKTKVSALRDATEATWDSAKQNAIASWDRLQAAYDKARAD
jgi:hypothetical protein